MPLSALSHGTLHTTSDGFHLRICLPWIRSLPIASLIDPRVEIDGHGRPVVALLSDRAVPTAKLADESGWWFVQDRLVLRGDDALVPGSHEVTVAFTLAIPDLPAGADGPLRLPFRTERTLHAEIGIGADVPGVARDVA